MTSEVGITESCEGSCVIETDFGVRDRNIECGEKELF